MGQKGAIEVLEDRKMREISDPVEAAKYVEQKEAEYRNKFANPYQAEKFGYIDDVIEPRNTRFRIIRTLQTLLCCNPNVFS